MPKNPAYMNQDERAAYRSAGAERARAWREANKEYAAQYQRERAKAKAQEKPERGYHLTECSGKCKFYQRCSMWRLEFTAALPVRENLSGEEIRHLARRLPCEAE